MDPDRKSDRICFLFTQDRSGTSLERIQNWTRCAGPVLDPTGRSDPLQTPGSFPNGST